MLIVFKQGSEEKCLASLVIIGGYNRSKKYNQNEKKLNKISILSNIGRVLLELTFFKRRYSWE